MSIGSLGDNKAYGVCKRSLLVESGVCYPNREEMLMRLFSGMPRNILYFAGLALLRIAWSVAVSSPSACMSSAQRMTISSRG